MNIDDEVEALVAPLREALAALGDLDRPLTTAEDRLVGELRDALDEYDASRGSPT